MASYALNQAAVDHARQLIEDYRRLHRTRLIACVYRASQWRHKDVEIAAHDLLQYLDRVSSRGGGLTWPVRLRSGV
jgi:hypothetical protein